MQHPRGVNSAPTGGEVRRFYVSPVLKYETVNGYIPVNGGIRGESDNQLSMLPVPRRFSLETIRGEPGAGPPVLGSIWCPDIKLRSGKRTRKQEPQCALSSVLLATKDRIELHQIAELCRRLPHRRVLETFLYGDQARTNDDKRRTLGD